MTTKIVTMAHLTPGLVAAWLQHLRDFDIAHPGCHFEVAANAPDEAAAEVMKALEGIRPGFAFTSFTPRRDRS